MAAFFDIIHQDPILSAVKLIAEPWDLGPDGYQVGNFPVLWSEWNGRFRDSVRRFWKGSVKTVADMGYRLTGSSDLFGDDGRHPHASINFVTAHDGFTLHDLVTFEKKRNEANGEGNRDGWDDDASWNCGVEGETSDERVNELRARQVKNFLATLILSQGVPMITMGDEMGRTQRGNNNAYCQDNAISWLDWRLDARARDRLAWTERLLALRREHPVFRRRSFFSGARLAGTSAKDIAWIRPDGTEMRDRDWADPARAVLGLVLHGELTGLVDEKGVAIQDETFLLVLNADNRALRFTTPGDPWADRWKTLIDTSRADDGASASVRAGETLDVAAHSFQMLVGIGPANAL